MAWYDRIVHDPRFIPKSNRFVRLVEQAGISSFDTYVGDPNLISVASRLMKNPETRRDAIELIVGDYVDANTIANNPDLISALSPTDVPPSQRVRAIVNFRRRTKDSQY